MCLSTIRITSSSDFFVVVTGEFCKLLLKCLLVTNPLLPRKIKLYIILVLYVPEGIKRLGLNERLC